MTHWTVAGAVVSAIACATSIGLGRSAVPEIRDITHQDNAIAGVLVNPLPERLTAWTVDVVGSDNRPVLTVETDALAFPERYVPANGSVPIQVQHPDRRALRLAFKAAITESGSEVGNARGALSILEGRVRRVTALDDLLEYLESASAAADETLPDTARQLVGPENQLIVDEVRSRAGHDSVHDWIHVARSLRDINQDGSRRYAPLKARIQPR
jgi:hypothetical protein